MSCPTPGPARLKGFSAPLSRVIAREYEKALCACARAPRFVFASSCLTGNA